jgi:hypothetical protein
MAKVEPSFRVPLIVGLSIALAASAACVPRLDERQGIDRLSTELGLPAAGPHVRTISRDSLPVATVEYSGAAVSIRFRRHDGTWVVDAVENGNGWEPAEAALAGLGHMLVEQAPTGSPHSSRRACSTS